MDRQLEQKQQAEQFGKYLIRREIGRGGMAEVFLAEMSGPSGFAKPVALKCLLPALSDNARARDAFVSEARLCGYLNHHNIVQTVDFGLVGDRYFLAMEYVDGATLAQILRCCGLTKRSLSISTAIEIVRQICDGLEYAHSAEDARGQPLHMIHRDLKPSNILINRHGLVKIADFGVAKATSNLSQTVTGTLKGTIAYMSPEQAACETIDHRTDLFSLGAMLFALLTLEPLYLVGESLQGVAQVIRGEVEGRLAQLAGFPPPLVAVIRKLLMKNPALRYGSAAAVKRDLLALQSRLPDEEPADLVALVRETTATTTAPRNREHNTVSLSESDLADEASGTGPLSDDDGEGETTRMAPDLERAAPTPTPLHRRVEVPPTLVASPEDMDTITTDRVKVTPSSSRALELIGLANQTVNPSRSGANPGGPEFRPEPAGRNAEPSGPNVAPAGRDQEARAPAREPSTVTAPLPPRTPATAKTNLPRAVPLVGLGAVLAVALWLLSRC